MAMGPGYGMRSLTDALFREAGFRPRIAFESQDSHTVRGLVSAGLGVSILPPGGSAPGRAASAGSHHRPQGAGADDGGPGWVEIPLDSALAFREIGLAWRERRGGADAEPDPVRLFRELVLRDGPGPPGRIRARTLGRLTGPHPPESPISSCRADPVRRGRRSAACSP